MKKLDKSLRFYVFANKFHGGEFMCSCDTLMSAIKIKSCCPAGCTCGGEEIIDSTGKLQEDDLIDATATAEYASKGDAYYKAEYAKIK